MTECFSQMHGFTWEKEILANVYHVTLEELRQIKYNSKMDLPAIFNRLDGCDISIKTTCHENIVCMADCLRVYDAVSSGEPFHLIVIFYSHDDLNKIKKINYIIEIDLTNSRELTFGSLTRFQIEELVQMIKTIPSKRKPTKEEHDNIYSMRNSLQRLSGAIQLNVKCNSSQSRLQCSFNRFKDFIESNPSRVIDKSNNNEFKTGIISPQLSSNRRRFRKKLIV